jgi:hypothetical protein
MSELHQQLQDSIQELERIRKIKLHTQQLEDRLIAEMEHFSIMEKTLQQEQRDVELLEKEGLTTMLRKFIGDREEKLEKERAEYVKASLKYNALFKSIEVLKFELGLLRKKEQDEDSVVRRIEVQMKMREEEIMQLNTPAAEELRNLYAQTDKLHKYSVEVDEAFNAGLQAHELVRRTEQLLQDALRHGQHDTWGGKSFGKSNLKHYAIDQARDLAGQARHALIRFGNEIKDVFTDIVLEVKLDIEALNKFTDILFDNFIFDMIAQQMIKKSMSNVVATRQQVEHAMRLLQEEKGNVSEKLKRIEEQRKEIVVQ